MTTSIEEFHTLVEIICNPSSPVLQRQSAELRLHDIQHDKHSWHIFINYLTTTDQNLLFFIAQGLQSAVWRIWSILTAEQQNYFTISITNTLTQRSDILPFARSKLEQVLAAICACSVSLLPVLSIVVELQQPGFEAGVSALRTVFEEVLKDDRRILPDHKKALYHAATEVAEPLSTLVSSVLNSPSTGDSYIRMERIVLELLRELVVRLPVGSHLSFDVLRSLFGVVDRSHTNNDAVDNAVLAVEVLCDVMAKKYVPRVDGCSEDTGAVILVEMVAQAVTMLMKMNDGPNSIENHDTALSLLEFVRVFVDSHMQRCIITSNNTSGSTVVEVFLEQFSDLTRSCSHPESLHKVVMVWEGLMDIEVAKEVLLTNQKCLEAGFHIYQAGLMRTNESLLEMLEEIEDDITVDPFSDDAVKHLLSHLSSRGHEIHVEKDNDNGVVGYALLQSITRCVTGFSESTVFLSELARQSKSSLQTSLAEINGGNAAASAMDTVYLLKLMPMCMSVHELIPSLFPLVQTILEQRSYSRGKAHIHMFQMTCKLLESLIRAFENQVASSKDPAMQEQLVGYLGMAMDVAVAACDVIVAPAPLAVMGSAVVLLLEAMSVAERPSMKEHRQRVAATLEPGMTLLYANTNNGLALPLEVGTLLFCACSELWSGVISTATDGWGRCLQQCQNTQGERWTTGSLGNFSRYTSSMDALARYRADSTPAVRQAVVEQLLCVAENMNRAVSSLLEEAIATHTEKRTAVTVSVRSALSAVAALVSLSQALLQNLGKKHFFSQGSQVLMICHALICGDTGRTLGENKLASLLFEGSGLDFVHQVLKLAQTVASTSSSVGNTISEQTSITHQILSGIGIALNDKTLCADLLEDVLQCGWTSVSCYWQGGDAEGGTCQATCGLFNAAPNDALVAVKGPMMLQQNRRMFAMQWFKDHCWTDTVRACLKALLLGIHPIHHDSIGGMLRTLITTYNNSPSAEDSMELWSYICNQVLEIASGVGLSSDAERCLREATQSAMEPALQRGARLDSVVDVLLDHVVRPLSADILRHTMSIT